MGNTKYPSPNMSANKWHQTKAHWGGGGGGGLVSFLGGEPSALPHKMGMGLTIFHTM